jgi:hypothetical protein
MSRPPRKPSWLLAILLAVATVDSDAAAETEPEIETATFSMYCYWTGEAAVGQVDGVLASRIGHWAGSEIVQVDFDPARTGVGDLVSALEGRGSFYSVVVGSEGELRRTADRVDPGKIVQRSGTPRFIEPKHSLRVRHPEIWALGLSERQAILLNTWSHFGGEMPDVLTDEQKARLER